MWICSETRSVNSFASSFSQRSFFGKLNKYELKRRFYEKLDDFKNKVLLHKEQGFVVYRARCMYSGGVVVLKGYSRESLTLQTRQRVFSEVSLLQRAQCPFILKCFDSFEDQGWWWLVLENCAAGDLYRIVQQNGPVREEGWLVSQVRHGTAGYPKDMVGTLDYVAPEVFVLNGPNAKQQEVTHYDYKVDIWGVGVMAYDVLVGTPPFNTDDPNTTVENILLREAEYPDFMSDDAVDFIDQCLTKDPSKRPTARQLLTHPWIRTNLDWEPPEDFDDPIPNIDFSYYRVGGHAGEGLDDSGDDEDDGRRWYNPISWLRRRNSLEDLLAEEPGGSAGQPVRGAWRLTTSIGNMAKALMGNRTQVAPDQHQAPSSSLSDHEGPGDGKKAFQMLPGRSMKGREDLEGVPEGDEEGLDPESGTPRHHDPNGRPPAANGGGGTNGLNGLVANVHGKGSFSQRPFSPPPLALPPLQMAANGNRADDDMQMTSARSGGFDSYRLALTPLGGTSANSRSRGSSASSAAAAAAAAAAAPPPPPPAAGGAAPPGAALSAEDSSLHPVLPAGASKTTPRERADARRLAGGGADVEEEDAGP
ncbi:hypothetical protein GPECTOR_23g56 [Gonium pectorale]|uniref:Protein kinase domain-containing protein n=1 Tax=Gonium pectorale TaxID=33097 RepID=A0A150GH42_GONPE|nr:hypothetical protein GPECTOR_23g56 [Gonium pectorale]|eukprot:KXZ49127.1 hypothetical protein GPECTOR_23g56 [Gonium pectorale]